MKSKPRFLLILMCLPLIANAQTHLGTNSFASTVNNPLPNQAAIEVRELNRGLQQTGSLGEAPCIGMHWGNRVWGHFLLGADGIFRLMNWDRSAYSSFFIDNLYTIGSVGIGTTNPQTTLDVNGNATISGSVITNEIHFIANDVDGWGTENSDPYTLRKVHEAGNISHLDLNLNDDFNESFRIYGNSCAGYNCGTYSGNLYHSFDASGNVYHAGNVGIGTTSPDQKLTVKGKIHAEEVIVDLAVPADYVFAKDYTLMPLHKVEQYVQTNNHLPDVPSATEIKGKGLNIGEMQNKLLQKIEELTLYVIEQDKSKKELETKYNELLTKVNQLIGNKK